MSAEKKLPDGWEVKRLGDVCEKITDGTHQTPTYHNDGYVFLSSRNVTSGKIDWDDIKYIDQKQHDEMYKRVAPRMNDILLAKNGTTGIAAMVDRDTVFDIYVSLALLRPTQIILPELLLEFINSPSAKMQFNKRLKGAGVPNLHLEEIREVQISFPTSISEQKRLLSILDQSFRAIDRAKENVEKNLANAREMFEGYLSQVFSNPGKDWEEKTIEGVCEELFAGGDAPKNNFSLLKTENYQIPIYANSVKDNGLYGYTDYYRVSKPSVTIAARGSGTGHTEIRYDKYLPIVRLIVLVPELSLISLEFLKCSIDNLEIMKSGSAIPQLTIPMIKEYILPLPSLNEQRRIVAKITDLSMEIKHLESIYQKKIATLDELKKSILQKAFSGEL